MSGGENKRSLLAVLDEGPEHFENLARDGFCIECIHSVAAVRCNECGDDLCPLCFTALHRKGTRAKHTSRELAVEVDDSQALRMSSELSAETDSLLTLRDSSEGRSWFLERSKYIPLRLSYSERAQLRLLEAVAAISEYTDAVDRPFAKAGGRAYTILSEVCACLSALVVAHDYTEGQARLRDRDLKQAEPLFQRLFEVARRHKTMNPEKMRTEYGKLLYLLMDTQAADIRETLDFVCVRPVKTVYSELLAGGALALLEDPLLQVATKEILGGRARRDVQADIKAKEQAIRQLSRKYASARMSEDALQQCIYSIGDNHCYLRENRDPIDAMIGYLQRFFDPASPDYDARYSLAIASGEGGARLSHDHARQYHYVRQSLTLWREVMHEMFKLWCLAEEDLLSGTPYELRDTGQGLNRVQPAPRTARAITTILTKAQKQVSTWIGSSVIHLGDTNVPNALMFIDKYTQIPRILNPIVLTITQLPELSKAKEDLESYFNARYGSVENLQREILCDFFKHAFDGSGGDNFFDAGSCIDGRLTSAWNWCSLLPTKRYYAAFKLTGFSGFDGSFK